jgi:tetratricopeptide (TPR) repeat protein
MVNLKKQPKKKPVTHTGNKNLDIISKKKADAGTKNFNKSVLLAVVIAVTFLTLSPTLNNGFIETWDDGVYVTENISITRINNENITSFFTTPVNGTYVPLPLLSLALDYHFFKLDPRPYHIHNLILHIICVILVFYVMRMLGLNPLFAAMVALFFGIHPMRVESVAWVTERKDLLFSLFYLASLLCWVIYNKNDQRKPTFYILTLLFFILSLFSKIQAVTLPLSLLLIDYFLKRPLRPALLMEKVPHFALSLGFGLAGVFILEKTGSLDINLAYSLTERIFFGSHSLCLYLVKLVWPHPLSIVYPYPVLPGNPLPWTYYLSPVLILILGILIYILRKKHPYALFGSLFFLFNIMFMLQILGAGTAFQADRFTYIPYLGAFFMAGWAGQSYTHRSAKSLPVIVAAGTAIVLVFSFMTFSRSKDWKNSETIWSAVINYYPDRVATAYANRASYYRNHDAPEKAIKDYNIAVRLDSKNGVYAMNRGNLYFDLGKMDIAFSDYQFALAHQSKGMDLFKLYANLGSVYGSRQNNDSAMYYLDLSIKINPKFATAYLNRALIFDQLSERENAIRDYQTYLGFKPEDDRVYSSIGVDYQYMGKFQESIPWFEKGMQWNPSTGLHYNNRAYSYNALGDKEKARADILKARELGFSVNQQFMKSLGIL